jgi:adenylosuccinate synthase
MDAVLDRFMSTVTYFVCNSRMAKFEDVRNLEYGKIVFEGAQGLLLDQDSPDFPHVTRSKTGLHNVASLLDDAGLKEWDLETFYVTRTYLTRHGAGPLPNATRGKPYQGVVDNTNTPNEWQGTLRYGVLDVDALGKRIVADTGSGSFNVVLTCVDQVDNGFLKVSSGGTYSRITVAEFVSTMKSYGAKKVFVSTGPTSSDVSEVGVCEVG